MYTFIRGFQIFAISRIVKRALRNANISLEELLKKRNFPNPGIVLSTCSGITVIIVRFQKMFVPYLFSFKLLFYVIIFFSSNFELNTA